MTRKLCCRVERIAFLVLLGTLCLIYVMLFNIEDIVQGVHHLAKYVQVKMGEQPTDAPTRMEADSRTTAGHRTSSQPSWPTCERNKSMADNVTGFSSLPGHIQDFLYYRHCRHFPLLLDVPDKCGGAKRSEDVFFLLAIKSSPGNYEQREVLRKTWGEERSERGKKIRRVFLLGTTGRGYEHKRLNRMLEFEQHEHRDIVQWDFNDSFYNLTLKQFLFMEWMDRNCPHVQFILNGDDDIFANTDNMMLYLLGTMDDNKEDNSKHLFVGNLNEGAGPVRDPSSKYYIPVQVQKSESYPPYCSGGGFLLSGYTALVIYNMSKTITFLPIDDVYFGMCLAKAGLKPASHPGVKPLGLNVPAQSLDPYHPCFYRETLLVHRFMPSQIYVMWHEAFDPNLKCGLDFGLGVP